MPKIQKQFEIYNYSECDPKNKNPNRPVTPTEIRKQFDLLITSIKNDDANDLAKLLVTDFIYPGNGLKHGDRDKSDYFLSSHLFSSALDTTMYGFSTNPYTQSSYTPPKNNLNRYNHYESVYQGDHHTRIMKYEYYDTQPVIVTLFLEHNALFQQLIQKLAESNNAALHQAFMNAFKKYPELPEELFDYDQTIKDQLIIRIQNISKYGEKLAAKNIPKADIINQLATTLDKMIEGMPVPIQPTATSQIRSLDFKFKLLNKLHSEDKILNAHRDSTWKHIVANVASILFTGSILNIINLFVTGNFFFFNETRSQTKVNAFSEIVMPNRYRFIIPINKESNYSKNSGTKDLDTKAEPKTFAKL